MVSEKHKVYISIGSNHPDCNRFVADAASRLNILFTDWRMCEPYKTKAINGVDADYLNAVAVGIWDGDEITLNKICKDIECSLGRFRGDKSSVVEIDIDIVCFDDVILRPVDYSREYFSIGFNLLSKDCR